MTIERNADETLAHSHDFSGGTMRAASATCGR